MAARNLATCLAIARIASNSDYRKIQTLIIDCNFGNEEFQKSNLWITHRQLTLPTSQKKRRHDMFYTYKMNIFYYKNSNIESEKQQNMVTFKTVLRCKWPSEYIKGLRESLGTNSSMTLKILAYLAVFR